MRIVEANTLSLTFWNQLYPEEEVIKDQERSLTFSQSDVVLFTSIGKGLSSSLVARLSYLFFCIVREFEEHHVRMI